MGAHNAPLPKVNKPPTIAAMNQTEASDVVRARALANCCGYGGRPWFLLLCAGCRRVLDCGDRGGCNAGVAGAF